jgi:transitional endoplasmic reticulum ATPase
MAPEKNTTMKPELHNIDQRIVDWIVAEFERDHGIDLSEDQMALVRVKEAAEKAQMELSTRLEAAIILPFITADASGPKHLVLQLTRVRFEQMVISPPPPPRGLAKVAGMHALKQLLRSEVIGPVRNPEPYRRYGLSLPNGILLYGPPGCGKTYIARHLAEELGHYFVEVVPSEVGSLWIHHTSTRIRQLFDKAAEQAPAVVFIDEFEALAPARSGLGGHQQYKAEEVNELLAHLNGCAEKKILVIAATNEPQRIDPAMLRTGRLDKHIYVEPPDPEARREMLALHLKDRPVDPHLDLTALAQTLDYYSASDLRFLVDEAARRAMRREEAIHQGSFESAMARIPRSFGPETESQYRLIEQRGF